MADALDYTHARGVIHRDIKPANVMIDNTGTTKIMDFGIARISDARTCTPTGMVMGTVEYMAPEQIQGEAADGRADQFALAVVAYQMMTGSTLYGPNTVATLTYKIVHETPVLPTVRNGALPKGVDAVLAKALAKKPADRFGSCKEFVGALAIAFSDAPTGPLAAPTGSLATLRTQTTIELPASATLVEPARHSHAPVVVAAIAVVLLAGALAAVIWKPWVHTQEGPAANANATAPTGPKSPAKSPGTAPVREPAPKKSAEAAADKPGATKAGAPAQNQEPVATEPVEAEMPVITPEPKNKNGASPYMQAMQHGEQQIKESDWMGAIRSFGDAIALRPNSAQAHYMRGTVYQHVDQFDGAMRDYTEAIHLEPKMVMAYAGLGGCYAHEQRDNEALVEFQRALELNPNAPLALFGRGNIYYRRKDYRRALADYDRVVEISPRFAPAYQNRAHAREAIGDMAGAAADRRTEQSLRKQ
jgi:Tfp pilus assembly protein PilF